MSINKKAFTVKASNMTDLLCRTPKSILTYLKNKYFTVIVKDFHGHDVFKVRSVNFNGLKFTANVLKDEETMNRCAWDGAYKRGCYPGVASYVPAGAEVELIVEVHNSKEESDETRDQLESLITIPGMMRDITPPSITEFNESDDPIEKHQERILFELESLKRAKKKFN